MRVILVVGTGRSGTSLVGGILHKLGVSMGMSFTPITGDNPRGTFEEANFFGLNRTEAPEEVYRDYFRDRDQEGQVWGVKDPQISHVYDRFWGPLTEDREVRIVHVKRAAEACIASYERAYNRSRHEAKDWYEWASKAVNRFLEEVDVPVLEVDFEAVLRDPMSSILDLHAFVMDGIRTHEESVKDPANQRFGEALSFIDPSLKHWTPDGHWVKHLRPLPEARDWGKIAVGVRVGSHPEPGFMIDWTALLTGGLRKWDTVLLPRHAMPAHWASNAIARDFLRTDRDTLLMIDDDMSFPMDAVEKLRLNRDNWPYDIVFAFCTHRVWPPKPVVLRRLEAPPEPVSLNGEFYEPIPNLDQFDNQVKEVDAVGLAFTLIRRPVLEAMVETYGPEYTFWFESMDRKGLFKETFHHRDMNLEATSWFTYGEGKESDDIPFSRKAREMGFRMAVDLSVKIDHIGTLPMGWHQYVDWLQRERAKRQKGFDLQGDELKSLLEEALPYLKDNRDTAEAILGRIEDA